MAKARKTKGQRRLNFEPLPSSSPGVTQLSASVQDRAAAVRLDGSPSKKQKISGNFTSRNAPRGPVDRFFKKEHDNQDELGLPTPNPSSQQLEVVGGSPLSMSKRHDHVQEILDDQGSLFEGVGDEIPSCSGSSDAKTQIKRKESVRNPFVVESSQPSRLGGRPRRSVVNARATVIEFSSGDDIFSSQQSTASRTLYPVSSPMNRAQIVDENDDEDDPISRPSRNSTRSKKPVVIEDSTDDLGAGEEKNLATPKHTNNTTPKKRSTGRRNKSPIVRHVRSFISGGTSGNAPVSLRKRNADKLQNSKTRNESRSNSSKKATPQSRTRSAKKDEQEALDEASDSDTGNVKIPRGLRGQRRKAPIVVDDSDDVFSSNADNQGDTDGGSMDELHSSPQKRHRLQKRKVSKSTVIPGGDDDEELQDDLQWVGDNELRDSRTRGANKHSKREDRLSKLRQLQKAREAKKGVRSSSPVTVNNITNEDMEEESENDEEGSEGESEAESALGHHPLRGNLNEYEDDFVDDDEVDEDADAEALANIPLHLTRHARKPLKEHFKDVVEWMVRKKIDPAFDRDNEMYTISFDRIDNDAKGLAGSKFNSSTWQGDFFRAVKARPVMTFEGPTRAPIEGVDICAACNRAKPCHYTMTFDGGAYDPWTLEPLKDDVGDEEDTSDESYSVTSRDINGVELPEKEKEFHLGGTCAKNAIIFHNLQHWRFSLFTHVAVYLENEGHMRAAVVLARQDMSDRKRSKTADKILAKMEEQGEVEQCYRFYKAMVKTAVEQKQDGWRRN